MGVNVAISRTFVVDIPDPQGSGGGMSVLSDLKKERGLFVSCPNCDAEFRLADAIPFDATKRHLPQEAVDYLSGRQEALNDRRGELRAKKLAATTRPRISAKAVNIGKVVEKIAPSLPGFPVTSSDCRLLLEPIDYVVFRGLSARGRVDSIVFADVKTGRGRLSGVQSQVKNLVERGKVKLIIAERPEAI
jgi:predicted Holliday junction resolvase-like endonuclease